MDGMNRVFEFVVVVKCRNILFVDQPHRCWAGGVYQACQCWADSHCWSATPVLSRQCLSGMPVLSRQCWSATPVLSRQCWSGSGMPLLSRHSMLSRQSVLIRHASVKQTVFQRQIWSAACWFLAHQFCGQLSKQIVVDRIHCNFL